MDEFCPTCKRPFRGVIEAFDDMNASVTGAVESSEQVINANTKMLGTVVETQRTHLGVLQDVATRLQAIKKIEETRAVKERNSGQIDKVEKHQQLTLRQQRQEIIGKVALSALALVGGVLMVIVPAWVAYYFDIPIPVLPPSSAQEASDEP